MSQILSLRIYQGSEDNEVRLRTTPAWNQESMMCLIREKMGQDQSMGEIVWDMKENPQNYNLAPIDFDFEIVLDVDEDGIAIIRE